MRFPVFLDANALYPASLADTLLRLAEAEVVRPHWSRDVMDELESSLAKAIGVERARKRRLTMEAAFPEAMVTGYDGMSMVWRTTQRTATYSPPLSTQAVS